MPHHQFKYFLLDRQGKFFYVDTNGKVRTTSDPTWLKNSPQGWNEKKMSWGRSVSYLGLVREYSVPLRFTFDGATILRYLHYTFGVEAYCKLAIVKLNKSFGAGLVHEDFTGCEVDFSEWYDQDDYVVTELKDGGLPKLVRANENTSYPIDITDEPQAITIKCDGIEFSAKANYQVLGVEFTMPISGFHLVPIQFVNREGDSIGISLESQSAPNVTSGERIINAALTTSIGLTGLVKFKVDNSVGSYIFLIRKQDANGNFTTLFTQTIATTANVIYAIPVTLTIPVTAGDSIQVTGSCTGGPSTTRKITYVEDAETIFIATYKSRAKTTFVKALRLPLVFGKVIEKIAGVPTPILSTALSQRPEIAITCGDAIRGLAGAKAKISLSAFFKSIRLPIPCGFGVDKLSGIETAIMESWSYFFSNTIIADLGEVVDFKKGNAKDWMANKINVGYPNQEYEEVNGRDEFNVEQTYTTSITRIVKEFDLISEFRADAFGFEYLRANFAGKTSTDTGSDNDVFLVVIDHLNSNADGSYNLYRGPYQSLSGVTSPSTIFNVPLSPKTCLLEHGQWWRSMFFHNEATEFVFRTSEKNDKLSYKQNNVTITESANVVIGDFTPGPLWLPYIFTFTTQVPVNLPTLMNGSGKYGMFQFTSKGKKYYGWVLEVSQQPADNEKQTWKLLASKDNNILNLIR